MKSRFLSPSNHFRLSPNLHGLLSEFEITKVNVTCIKEHIMKKNHGVRKEILSNQRKESLIRSEAGF